MNIDFGKIVTNALSALVATVFVGAAAIVWTEANSIDKKISKASSEIETQQAKLEATQTTVVEEIVGLKQRFEILESQAKSLNKVLSENDKIKDKIVYLTDKPFVLEEFKAQISPEQFKDEEKARINKEIFSVEQRLLPNRM